MFKLKEWFKKYLIEKSTSPFIESFLRTPEKQQTRIRSSLLGRVVHTLCRKKATAAVADDIALIIFTSKKTPAYTLFRPIKKWAASGMRIVIVADRGCMAQLSFDPGLLKLLRYGNATLAYASGFFTSAEKLTWALSRISSSYVCLLDWRDSVNSRSFLTKMRAELKKAPGKAAYVFSEQGHDGLKKLRRAMDVTALSGCLFQRERLYSIVSGPAAFRHGWLGKIIFDALCEHEIHLHHQRMVLPATHTAPLCDCMAGYARMVKDTMALVDTAECLSDAMEIFEVFLNAVRESVEKTRSKTKLGILASGCALLCAHMEHLGTEEELETLTKEISAAFSFDSLLSRPVIHNIHRTIVEAVIPVEAGCVAVIETKFMEDLKESLVPHLLKFYNVIYMTKREEYDFPKFNFMVMKTLSQKAMFIISSMSLSKDVIGNKKLVVMWHGLGMMKRLALRNRSSLPMDYIITSSKSCVKPWSKTFWVKENNVLPLGQIQTDILFNKEFVIEKKQVTRKIFNISDNKKICFFAPTFRMNSTDHSVPKYYDFMMDIETLAERLEAENTVIITKKHHVFSQIMADRGVDTSGVHTSKNRHFIVDEQHDFVDLVAAADIFITDYSSGMFYSFVMNQPVMLYAPDVDTYRNGANGFMIDYPSAIPAPFVGKPDIDAFMQALKDADRWPSTSAYAAFREEHVGACDGHVAEKFMCFLATWNGRDF